jgi:hypothetical protein
MVHKIDLDNRRTQIAIADLKDANPGLPVRPELIALDGDERPWPCVYPGCMMDSLDAGTLCAEHEIFYIAQAGKRSPLVSTITEWNDQLHARAAWLLPYTKFGFQSLPTDPIP